MPMDIPTRLTQPRFKCLVHAGCDTRTYGKSPFRTYVREGFGKWQYLPFAQPLSGKTQIRASEVKWLSILRNSFRDIFLLGFGAWILWKQSYSLDPNAVLAGIGFACMVPSARHAVLTLLSEPASSSESPHQPSEPHSEPSSSEDTGEGAAPDKR